MSNFCMLSPEWDTLEMISLGAACIGLVSMIVIFTRGTSKLFNDNNKASLSFKSFFTFTAVFAIVIYVSIIIGPFMCTKFDTSKSVILNTFIVTCCHLFILTVSLLFYARLYTSSKANKFAVNPKLLWSLSAITLISTIIGTIGGSLCLRVLYDVYVAHNLNIQHNIQFAITVSCIGHIVYIILSIMAVVLFKKELTALTMFKSSVSGEQSNDALIMDTNGNVEEDVKQSRVKFGLIHQQARYVMFLGIALLSSCVFYSLLKIKLSVLNVQVQQPSDNLFNIY